MISAGDQAPDFELVDQNGETVRLRDLRGTKVVLYFYESHLTPQNLPPGSVCRSRPWLRSRCLGI